MSVDSQHKKYNKQNGGSNGAQNEALALPIVLQDDLLEHQDIYHLWMTSFSDDIVIAEQKWFQYRKTTKEKHEEFDKKMKKLESDTHVSNVNDAFFDLGYLQEKKVKIDSVLGDIDKHNKDFAEMSKSLEQFCLYLPKDIYRKRVDLLLRNLRRRYFNFVQYLYTKKELLRWVIPRFETYRSAGSKIKVWLDGIEARSKNLFSRLSTKEFSALDIKGNVEAIAGEIRQKRDIYKDFIDVGKSILDIEHNLKMNHLEEDIDDVIVRWDYLCEKIETCLTLIIEEEDKKFDELIKHDTDKIDRQIKDEYHQCTCCKKFNIEKVEDGRYVFGAAKTIRLLRIHGNSIVVRVGGGWEYLYNFLYKVDPCRAKQLANFPEKAIERIKYLSGISLIPADHQDTSYTMSVQRMYKSSWKPVRNSRVNYHKNADHWNSAGESSLSSLSTSTSSSSTSSIPHAVEGKEFKKGSQIQRTNSERSESAPPIAERVQKSKLNKSTGSLNKNGINRRVSLMERQKQYARKRCPSATMVIDH